MVRVLLLGEQRDIEVDTLPQFFELFEIDKYLDLDKFEIRLNGEKVIEPDKPFWRCWWRKLRPYTFKNGDTIIMVPRQVKHG